MVYTRHWQEQGSWPRHNPPLVITVIGDATAGGVFNRDWEGGGRRFIRDLVHDRQTVLRPGVRPDIDSGVLLSKDNLESKLQTSFHDRRQEETRQTLKAFIWPRTHKPFLLLLLTQLEDWRRIQ